MISIGWNPLVGDYDGRTVMHIAASSNNIDALQYLQSVPGMTFNVYDRWGATPVDYAVRCGNDAAVALLSHMGGDPKLEKVLFLLLVAPPS